MKKRTLVDFNKMKAIGKPLTWITAYDFPTGYAAEKAEVDMILVGDSGGMVQLGYETTNPVTMDEMLMLAKAARRGAPNTFIVGDMPQGSYEVSQKDAIINSLRFIKEANCDAIKCEGGKRVTSKVRSIVDAGILVIGHLGLTPQSAASFGGYRVQGRTKDSFESILNDALALQEAGAMAILLEAMPAEPAGQIAMRLKIPIYGIGVGNQVDGQLIIMHDLLGFYPTFRPTFAKCYIPDVVKDYISHINEINIEVARKECRDGFLEMSAMAIRKYVEEVRNRRFPDERYTYKISEQELEDVMKSDLWIEEKLNNNSCVGEQKVVPL